MKREEELFSHTSNFVFTARVWVEQDRVAQASFNASAMSESIESSDASMSERCQQCGSRCGGRWFCQRGRRQWNQWRQWKQWSRSPDQQPLWMFLWFLKAHEIPGLYNVIRQDLIRFSGRPRMLDGWTAEGAALNSSDPSVHPDQIDEEVILRLGH